MFVETTGCVSLLLLLLSFLLILDANDYLTSKAFAKRGKSPRTISQANRYHYYCLYLLGHLSLFGFGHVIVGAVLLKVLASAPTACLHTKQRLRTPCVAAPVYVARAAQLWKFQRSASGTLEVRESDRAKREKRKR